MREGDGGRVHVEGLRQEPISSIADAVRLIAAASSNRVTAGTNTNAESSRSHAVFTLKVTAELQGDEPGGGCGLKRLRTTSLHLVDLAGSERQKDSNASGMRLREACSINKSLSALGKQDRGALKALLKDMGYRGMRQRLKMEEALLAM